MAGDDRPPPRAAGASDGFQPGGSISRQDAVGRARTALAEAGEDMEGHDVSVAEREDEWLVTFEPPAPAPPGTERAVFVAKSGGGVRIVRGE